MKIGTKTLLFGVHQFLWHPLTVWHAWVKLYGRQPHWWELVAIFCHDLGYWGLPNLDGPEGREHPLRGARIASQIVFRLGFWFRRMKGYRRPAAVFFAAYDAFATYNLALGHSRELARAAKTSPSPLCWADKYCIFSDPTWFYLLRAHLSGEIQEFKQHAQPILGKVSSREWHKWYQQKVYALIREKLWS